MSSEEDNLKLMTKLDEQQERARGRASSGNPIFAQPTANTMDVLGAQAAGESVGAGALDLDMYEETGRDVGFRDFFEGGLEGSIGRAGQEEQAQRQQKRWAQPPKPPEAEPWMDNPEDIYAWEVQDAYESTNLMHDGRIPENYGQLSEAGQGILKSGGYDLGKGVPIGVNMDNLSPEAKQYFQAQMMAAPTAGQTAGPAKPEFKNEGLRLADHYKHSEPSQGSSDRGIWEQATNKQRAPEEVAAEYGKMKKGIKDL